MPAGQAPTVPDTDIFSGQLGFPGVFSSNFDFQLARLIGAQTYGAAELGECLVTARRIADGDLEAWTREWSVLAAKVEDLAVRSRDRGHVVSAREAYLRAASYYRTALFYLPHRDTLKRELYQRCRSAFVQAGKLFEVPFEPVSIPFEGMALPGYFLRAGVGSEPRPTVLIQGGGDTVAEELYDFGGGAAAIRRGFNALLFDGPGQVGAAQLYPDIPYRPDWEKPVSAVVDYALTLPEVDASRLAIVGFSFGGALVPRAVAFDKRLRACVASSLVPGVGAGVRRIFGLDATKPIPEGIESGLAASNPLFHLLLHDWLPRLGGTQFTVAELDRVRSQYCLWGLEDKITCALLAISTVGEGQVYHSEAREFFDAVASKNKKFVLLTEDDGANGHCAINNESRIHQEIFDWLGEVLDVHPRP